MRITLRDFGLKHKHPACDGKRAYASQGAAEAHIRALRKLRDRQSPKRIDRTVGLVSYECRRCAQWHVGHKKEN